MYVLQGALDEAAKAFMSRTLHISTSQSMCGNCGRTVNWAEFSPLCPHCPTRWIFVVAGFMIGGWTDEDYKERCESIAPGLIYVTGRFIGTLVPRPDYLKEKWVIRPV